MSSESRFYRKMRDKRNQNRLRTVRLIGPGSRDGLVSGYHHRLAAEAAVQSNRTHPDRESVSGRYNRQA